VKTSLLPARSARRVYHALAWLCARRPASARRLDLLRARARALGLSPEATRAVEAEAAASRSVRVGRDPAERSALRDALLALAHAEPALAPTIDAFLRRVALKLSDTPTPRPCPFEESEPDGPPLVWSGRQPRVA
jgi:hypothetical protein